MSFIEKRIIPAILARIRAHRMVLAARKDDSLIRPGAEVAPAKLREAAFSDFGAVAKLKQRWGLANDSLENWERLWRHNPALAQYERRRPIGWVLEADGVVVGYLGNISLLYHYQGKTLSAVTGHGLVADPLYRAQAVSLVAAFYRQRFVDLYLGTSAIPEVWKIARAFKADLLPQPDYGTVFFWVLIPRSFAQDLVQRLGVRSTLMGASVASVSIAIAIDRLLRRRFPGAKPPGFEVSEIGVNELGEDFQDLWCEKLKKDRRILADRSPAVLRWHFEIPGDKGSARVLCCRRNGKLVGYAIVRSDPQSGGLRKSIVADMLAVEDDAQVVKALLVAAYSHAQLGGSYILEVMGFPPGIRRVCSLSNPYSRNYPGSPFHYKAAEKNLHGALSEDTAWYASPFDGDATLIRPSFPLSFAL